MSLNWMAKVWQNGPKNTSDRLVLLCLADFAGESGLAWPSIKTLTERTALSDRGVQKSLRRMEADGWLEIATGNGRKGCNNYQLKTPNSVHPEQCSPPNITTETPNVTTQNPEQRSPEPLRTVIEPSIIPLSQGREAREDISFDDFSQFWALWPNKVQERFAREQFPFALIRSGSLEAIVDGVHRYIADVERNPRPFMNAHKWLYGDCWNDQYQDRPQPRQQQKINPRMEANRRFLERHMKNEQPSNTGASVLKLVNGSTNYD